MRRQNLLLITGALLLLAGLAVWLLRGSEHDGETAAVLGRATPTAGAPTYRDAAPDREAATPNVLPATAEPAAVDAPAPPAAAPPATAAEDDSVEAVFRGRVVDHRGLPIAEALVVYWPSLDSRSLYNLGDEPSGAALDVLPRVFTDGGGRFELHGRHRKGSIASGPQGDPMLAVLSGDLAIRSRLCKAFAGGEYDAGDIPLEPGARLTGRVVDGEGRAIAEAVIIPPLIEGRSLLGTADRKLDWAFDELSGAFAATTSGSDGRFTTGALWDGTVQLDITAEGFLAVRRDFVQVTVGGRNDLGDIVLDRGAALAGSVRDAHGTPVADARVIAFEPNGRDPRDSMSGDEDRVLQQLRQREANAGVRTDAGGRFLIPALKSANHCLIVDAAGFEPLRVPDLLPGGSDLSLTVVRAAMLQITVVDATTKAPLVGASVRADRGGVELPVRSGAAPGVLLIERLGLRRTELTVEAPGYGAAVLALEGVTPPAQIERTLGLLREARVSGHVWSADGAPLVRATVVAETERAEPPDAKAASATQPTVTQPDALPPRVVPVSVATDEQGRYLLAGLAPGSWTLSADAPDFMPVERTVALGEGQAPTDIDFTLPPAASLFGVCYAEDGTPDAGVLKHFNDMNLDAPGPRAGRQVRSDDQGHYELRDLRPGPWRVTGNPTVDVALVAGERRELDLRANPEARVSGRVLQADGTPAPHALVFLTLLMEGGGGTQIKMPLTADEEGHFERKPAYPGRYDVVAVMPAPGGGISPTAVFDLHESEQRILELRLGGLAVRGRVVDSTDGTPIAGAAVAAQPLLGDGSSGILLLTGPSGLKLGGVSDADGRFELTSLAPGPYALLALVPEGRSEAQPPLMLAPGPVPDVELRIARTGSVSGTAHSVGGVPMKDGLVVYAEQSGSKRSALLEDGHFTLLSLLPGSWLVSLRDQNVTLVEQSVTVFAGQHAEVELIVP